MDKTGALAAVAAAVLYGSAYVAIAVALDDFTPLGVAIWRGAFGALVLGPVVFWHYFKRGAPPNATALVRLFAMAVFGGGVFVLATNAAVALAGATITAFVAGLYAVAAAVLAIPILAERPRRRTGLALVAAFIGTALLSGLRADGLAFGGVAAGLIAALAFGMFLVLSRRFSRHHGLSGPVVSFAMLSVSAVAAIVVAIATGDRLAVGTPSLSGLASVIWAAVCPGAAASALAVIAMQRLRAEQASTLLLLNPPTAALLAFVLLGERLTAVQVAGAALVLAAIAVASAPLPRRMAFPRSSPRDSGRQLGS
jgi:drug/metabolite transporter (DMT)-like permease